MLTKNTFLYDDIVLIKVNFQNPIFKLQLQLLLHNYYNLIQILKTKLLVIINGSIIIFQIINVILLFETSFKLIFKCIYI